VHALWVEGRLSWVERLCLSSARAVGHPVTLYTYRGVDGVPAGIDVADARTVTPFEQMLRHKGSHSWALGSDLFRFAMQRQGVGIYIDTDVYFLKPLPPVTGPVLFGWQKPGLINGAVLWFAPDSALLREIDAYLAQAYIVPHWIKWRKKVPYMLRKWLKLRPLRLEEYHWGVAGPRAITLAAAKSGLERHALPQAVLYPYGPKLAREAFDPASDVTRHFTAETCTVHLWNEVIRKFKNAPPPAGSFMARLCAEQGLDPHET
jgi:hypothetical protein